MEISQVLKAMSPYTVADGGTSAAKTDVCPQSGTPF